METKKVIGEKYEIQHELTRGRAGVIFYGVDRLHGKPLAIKMIDPGPFNESWQVSAFEEEMRLLTQLSHHNLASVHDLKHDDSGKIYVIMEYIDGFNLQRVLQACHRQKKRLPEGLCVYIAAEAGAALDFIHSCRHRETQAPLNLIHQELSPSHIIITRAGEIKLIGFGMRNFRPQSAADQGGNFAPESLNYLAPEQRDGAATLDHRVDIFALGLVLYEALAGKYLIAAGAPDEAPENGRYGRAYLSCLRTEAFSPKLQEILCRALAPTPDERYANANQMYMDLMHYLMLIAPELNCKAALAEFVEKVYQQKDSKDEVAQSAETKTATTPEDGNAPGHETENQHQTPAEFFNGSRANKNFAAGNGEALYEEIPHGKTGMAQGPANARDSISASNGHDLLMADFVFEVENALRADETEKFALLLRPPQAGGKDSSLLGAPNLANASESAEAPWPKNKPQLLPGDDDAVPGEALYIRRAADASLEKQIQRTGATTIIEGAPQTGKSALLAKAHAYARQNHRLICHLDFHFFESHQLQSLETLYQAMARKIILGFKAPIKVGSYWDESLGTKDNLTYFVEEAILSKVHVPILMILDEIDPIFRFPYRNDFFATIRGWHNRRAIEENWSRLNLIIAHSTEPYLWSDDLNQSPFNVGQRITLENFSLEQAVELNIKHDAPLQKDGEIKKLMRLVGGQPYLVQQALSTLANHRWSLPELQKVATAEMGPFSDHLHRHTLCLQENKVMRESLRQVLHHGRCDNESHFQRLKAVGLVRGESRHHARMRCRLYEEYFKRRL